MRRELRDGAVGVAGAHVQIAERVDRVPVARLILDQPHVFRDGSVELSLAEQLLRLLQRRVAIYGTAGEPTAVARSVSRSYQTGCPAA